MVDLKAAIEFNRRWEAAKTQEERDGIYAEWTRARGGHLPIVEDLFQTFRNVGVKI